MSKASVLLALVTALCASFAPGPALAHGGDEVDGELEATIPVPGVPLGMAFDAAGGLYVANFGGGNVLRFSPPFNAGSTPAVFSIAGCTGPFDCGLNALAFDSRGDLYVSDSFGGRIFRLHPPSARSSVFFEHDLLKPGSHGFPGFGANGLAFDSAGALYIANTADDRLLKLVSKGNTRTLTTFAESINGADGIGFDGKGRLWVAANQGDELVAFNSNGRIVERLGSFKGIGADGAPIGLLFPASFVLAGGSFYVTNLALALTPAVGDEPEEAVATYTVSRIALPD